MCFIYNFVIFFFFFQAEDGIRDLTVTGVQTCALPIFNGPIRGALDINCGAGVFGPGWRANATIGRALRLVCVNLGGAAPGVISMSTLAHPGRYTYCIGEREEASPWESLSVEHGFAPSDSTVDVLAADGPLGVYDHQSRTPEDLLATLAASMAVVSHHKMTHWGDTLLVLSPEHVKILGEGGWKKADVRRWLFARLQRPVCELLPGRDGGEGLPEHVLRKFTDPAQDRKSTRLNSSHSQISYAVFCLKKKKNR